MRVRLSPSPSDGRGVPRDGRRYRDTHRLLEFVRQHDQATLQFTTRELANLTDLSTRTIRLVLEECRHQVNDGHGRAGRRAEWRVPYALARALLQRLRPDLFLERRAPSVPSDRKT